MFKKLCQSRYFYFMRRRYKSGVAKILPFTESQRKCLTATCAMEDDGQKSESIEERGSEKFKYKMHNCRKEDDNPKCNNEDSCKDNVVAVFHKEHGMKLETRERPTPRQGQVLIAMDCVGLCSNDLHSFRTGKLPTPLVLARDGTGIVTELGKDVENLCEGDRVVIEPKIYCGKCEFCKNCQKHLCNQAKSCGLEPYDGLLVSYYTHPAEFCHKLPDNITMEEGVLINMLGNGINICSRCPFCIGASVLVIGAGPIGLISYLAAKALGSARICITCKFKDRLDILKQFDANTLEIPSRASAEDVAHYVREKMGCMPEITIDSVGSEESMKIATAATASGGTIVLASVTDEKHKISLHELAHRDISIRSALKHADKFPAAISLASNRSVNLKPLISHHFCFEEVSNAIDTLMENEKTSNKVIIHIQPRDQNNKTPF